MSEEIGQKRTKIRITITVDQEAGTIAVVPEDGDSTIGEMLAVLLAGYDAVLHTGREMLDMKQPRVLQ